MSRIKSILLLVCLLVGVSLYSQSKDTLFLRNSTYSFKIPNLKTVANETLSFKKMNFSKNTQTLSIFNSTTNLYDNYIGDGNSYNYNNSNIFFENKSNFLSDIYLGNNSFMQSNSLMQNHSFMQYENANYRVRDSFNPHGATNMRQALVGGVLGLLFN